jgi:hypothetical protein
LADCLSELSGWSEQIETELANLHHAELYDDQLGSAATDAAEGLKDAMRSEEKPRTNKPKSRWAVPGLGVEGWKTELKVLAADLRLIAGSQQGEINASK